MMQRKTTLLILICLIVFCAGSLARAQLDTDLVEEIKKEMLAQRASIKTGAFTAKGTVTGVDDNGNVTHEYGFEIFYAFDREKKLERINHTVFDADGKVATSLGQWIGGPLAQASMLPDGDTIMLHPPDPARPLFARVFDFRSLGLAFPADVGGGFSFDWTWEACNTFPVSDVKDHDNGLVEYTWNEDRHYLIDAKKGHWPLKLKTDDKHGYWVESELEVVQINGTWVPKEFMIRQNRPDGSTTRKFSMKWESVNEEIDSDYFAYTSFKKNGPVKIIDNTDGRRRVIKDNK
jgi:hypothetical protein